MEIPGEMEKSTIMMKQLSAVDKSMWGNKSSLDSSVLLYKALASGQTEIYMIQR